METTTEISEESLRAMAEEPDDGDREAAGASLLDEPFTIDTESRAQWAVNKLLGYDAEIERVRDQAAKMIDDLSARRRRFHERFEFELRHWLQLALTEQGGKKRSVDLLTGRIGFRKKTGGLRFVDSEETLEWAKGEETPMLRQPPTPAVQLDREAVRKHFTETGEIPPGCRLVDDTDDLVLTPPKG